MNADGQPINEARKTRLTRRANWFVRGRPRRQQAWSGLHALLYEPMVALEPA